MAEGRVRYLAQIPRRKRDTLTGEFVLEVQDLIGVIVEEEHATGRGSRSRLDHTRGRPTGRIAGGARGRWPRGA
jgi:hypothetical protein